MSTDTLPGPPPTSTRLDSFTLRYYLDYRYSSLLSTTFNLTLSLTSVATAGLPYAFADLNPLVATLIIAACGLASWYGGRILIMIADTRRCFYTDRMVEMAGGRWWAGGVWLALQTFFLSTAVALNMKQAGAVLHMSLPSGFVRDNVLRAIPASWTSTTLGNYLFGEELPFCILFYTLFTVPYLLKFTALPSVSSLSLASLIMYACVAACFAVDFTWRLGHGGFMSDDDDNNNDEVDDGGVGEAGGSFVEDWVLPKPYSFTVVGTLLYCFGNGFNSLVVYNSLRIRKLDRGLVVVRRSFGLSTALVFVFTLFAFFAYLPRHSKSGGGQIRINLFKTEIDDVDMKGMQFARVFFLLFAYFKFPLDLLLAKSSYKR